MATAWIPEPPADTPSNRLRRVRKGLDLTLADIEQRTGIKGTTWSTWENGKTPPHWRAIAKAVAAEFEVDAEWLEYGDEVLTRSTGWVFTEQLSFAVAA